VFGTRRATCYYYYYYYMTLPARITYYSRVRANRIECRTTTEWHRHAVSYAWPGVQDFTFIGNLQCGGLLAATCSSLWLRPVVNCRRWIQSVVDCEVGLISVYGLRYSDSRAIIRPFPSQSLSRITLYELAGQFMAAVFRRPWWWTESVSYSNPLNAPSTNAA